MHNLTVLYYFSSPGGSLWPFNNPVVHSPPYDLVLPDYEDEEDEVVVARPDIVDGPPAAEALRRQEDPNVARENARLPSIPLQPIPTPHDGMERPQQGHAPPFPALYPDPYSFPYAVPHPVPNAYSPAFPAAFPHAASIFPPAFPAGFPPAFLFTDPHAFALDNAAPAFPQPDPQIDQQSDPPTDSDYDSDDEFEQLMDVYSGPDDYEYSEFSDTGDEQVVPVFNIGPEKSSEDEESPSTSGLSSSTRRRREDSDQGEPAAKRPRWSEESDSDWL